MIAKCIKLAFLEMSWVIASYCFHVFERSADCRDDCVRIDCKLDYLFEGLECLVELTADLLYCQKIDQVRLRFVDRLDQVGNLWKSPRHQLKLSESPKASRTPKWGASRELT